MDRATVIVALPTEDDKVYRISSEKVPHLTLCYLGDQASSDDLIEIVEFVQHAAKQLKPFGLPVDYRGTLGADEADVIFFEKTPWDFPRINSFRAQLLQNDTISRAYESVDQFPEWTPHLTLGYPETPAKEDTSDYPGIHYVSFDRIAVWMGEFEGPTFRLKHDDYAMEVSMSNASTTERGADAVAELFHFGKKGMKWGVRNKDGGGDALAAPKERGKIKRGATKANTALDAGAKAISDGEKKLIFLPQKNRDKAAAATQGQVLAAAASINSSARFKGKDLKTDPALKADYFKQVETAAKKIYADELGIARTEAWAEFLGTKVDGTGMRITASSDRISHAEDGQETLLELRWTLNDLGQIEDVSVPETYLAHYGVKGMRWGVTTKDRATQRTPTNVTITQKKPGKFAKTTGGANHPLHEDAAKALLARQKAKSSTTDALSNKELRDAVDRMQLEQKYSQLDFSSDRRSRGARFVAGLFGQRKALKFKDLDEEQGEKIRKGVEKALAAKAARTAARAAAGA